MAKKTMEVSTIVVVLIAFSKYSNRNDVLADGSAGRHAPPQSTPYGAGDHG
jgi:hypothetical protein